MYTLILWIVQHIIFNANAYSRAYIQYTWNERFELHDRLHTRIFIILLLQMSTFV